ncbi:MAG: hypothetical protein CMN76_03170 [Spirochaetaceae bacterium]|nr:hypothetical protein [Spirochaetaceae bacterium]|tara:strand:+ start:78009 stop:78407 length:399 start_codon:yes stop_codon:yes gene_type:complete
MQYRPEAADLCEAIADYLLKEVMPAVKDSDELAYKALVSWNMLGVVAREMRDEEELLRNEVGRLHQILDEPGLEELETLQDVKKRIQELNVKLSEKVRKEKISDTNSQVWAHVRQTLVENLSISNPRFQTDS